MKHVVVVADPIHARGVELLRATPEFEVISTVGKPETLVDALTRAHALVVRSETKVTAQLIAGAPQLQAIGRAGIGVDNIDLDAATARGIAVLNTPGGNTVSAAEHALALLLSLVRRIPWAAESMRKGEWDRKRFGGTELRAKTLGLVGLGRIGSHVAGIARAFGMRVVAYDPFVTEVRAAELGVELSPLDDLLPQADAISLHLPLTDETRNVIDARRLGLMKPSAVIVNTARGGLIDEAALYDALTAGRIAGAAVDVFEQEPLPADAPLRTVQDVILTPHLAASTAEAQERVSVEICQLIRDALVTGAIGGAVNFPGLPGEALQRLGPLLDLARRLGRLATFLARGRVQAVEVWYGGDEEIALKPVSLSVIEGVLGAMGVGPVSLVNAAALAGSRGIKFDRHMGPPSAGFETTVGVRVRTGERTISIVGALIGDRVGRVIRIGEFSIDLPPVGHVIIMRNRDVPGVIGRVGTLLGEAHLNIGSYHQSRSNHGDAEALAAIAVDQAPDPSLVAKLEATPDVLEVRVANL